MYVSIFKKSYSFLSLQKKINLENKENNEENSAVTNVKAINKNRINNCNPKSNENYSNSKESKLKVSFKFLYFQVTLTKLLYD